MAKENLVRNSKPIFTGHWPRSTLKRHVRRILAASWASEAILQGWRVSFASTIGCGARIAHGAPPQPRVQGIIYEVPGTRPCTLTEVLA
ncbi:hypothetical protein CH63R_01007 [Colletotrichum higginsianum IMI 349063]|uniref:Uncharacterized protein n=1 Tax=Colletotrichum higginsianum (strain IMI 349063) TaxID=759273 RepID=A0A1B7YUV5_COLHI|nr:hypothetical protein CH63R_01007 [Colletotrichum higginsianum IMI 349063]OBR15827.1 hypothetical protein CH63R_01007 [Colletotrichum higginsianum IMI 349063]